MRTLSRQPSKSARRSFGCLAWTSWLIAAGALALAILPLVPPRSVLDPTSETFSVENALEQIEQIAIEPRPMGSEGNRRGREAIAAELRALGLDPQFQTLRVPNYYSRAAEPVEVANVLARISGTDSTGAVALMGHHDTFPTTPGANDDTSALAIMLECARAILAGPPLRNDVVLIFTDAEEPAPRYGSTAFAEEHPWFDDIEFVINLEAIGREGISVPVAISGSSRWIVGDLARKAPYPTAFSFITAITELIGGSNTDFSVFRDAGIPGMDIAYLAGSSIYHTLADNTENVGVRSLHQQGANTLAMTRHLGNLDLTLAEDRGESVFFTIGRFVLVRYPNWLALPLALLAAVVWLVVAVRQRKPLATLKGAGATLAIVALSMVLAAGIWTLVGRWRSAMGIAEGYVYLILLALVAAGIGWCVVRLFRRQPGSDQDTVGVLVLWPALAILTAVAAPGMSYLFTWPALVGGCLLLWPRERIQSQGLRLARFTLIAFVTLPLLIPAIDFLFQFANPRPGNPDSQVLAMIAVPVLLLSLTIELFRAFWPRVSVDKEEAPAGAGAS